MASGPSFDTEVPFRSPFLFATKDGIVAVHKTDHPWRLLVSRLSFRLVQPYSETPAKLNLRSVGKPIKAKFSSKRGCVVPLAGAYVLDSSSGCFAPHLLISQGNRVVISQVCFASGKLSTIAQTDLTEELQVSRHHCLLQNGPTAFLPLDGREEVIILSKQRRSEGIPPQGLSQSSFSVTKICVSPAGGVIHNGVGVHGVARGWRGVMEQRQTADENCGHTATADAVPPSPLPRFQFTVCYVSGDATPFISFLVLLIS
mmetsp:Transcript_37959/g.68061  ORF Transcript_37959/g.68061 Transcript_37959/m.68061 type:complete len:258 (-) Transcript_37959:257-1030(-)|eukprot:CAMPEP_0177764446 /NCGR_PEP_ID=MMETSP0491_2-20121128/7409_1 /TAXON_ID=63592 /ORGANISM="Tetraselmis chuii, Strain PLY429" /LENGTH=257 /DNA_ID=CAMNT_0019280621 /DNA_START=78 /DNA_END=851 /DNA_ORIENTATION=-